MLDDDQGEPCRLNESLSIWVDMCGAVIFTLSGFGM